MFFLVSWISLIWLLFLGLPQLDFDSIKCDSHKRLRSHRYVYITCWSFTSCTWWSLLPTGINTRCIGLAPRDTVGQPKAIKLGKVAYHDFRYCFTSPLKFYRSTQFFLILRGWYSFVHCTWSTIKETRAKESFESWHVQFGCACFKSILVWTVIHVHTYYFSDCIFWDELYFYDWSGTYCGTWRYTILRKPGIHIPSGWDAHLTRQRESKFHVSKIL